MSEVPLYPGGFATRQFGLVDTQGCLHPGGLAARHFVLVDEGHEEGAPVLLAPDQVRHRAHLVSFGGQGSGCRVQGAGSR